MRKALLILFLLISLSNNAWANLSISSNRDKLPSGELFILIIKYPNTTHKDPDFSPLKNENFTIYNIQKSSHIMNKNGVETKLTEWQISLSSTQTSGKIIIPPLTFEGETTQRLTIEIDNDSYAEKSEKEIAKKYKIYTHISPKEAFIEQQMNYTIIIEDSGNLEILDPLFYSEVEKDWIIKRQKEPFVKNNEENIREIHFNYLIFPKKSGEIKLPKAKVEGFYITTKNNDFKRNFSMHISQINSGFIDLLSNELTKRNPISLKTKDETIIIKPKENSNDWWLPAKNVFISSKWNTSLESFKTGEAISREIFIQAVGINDIQMPELKTKDIKGMKQYPDKASISSSIIDDDIVSISQNSTIYIPYIAGEITLPEEKITWFNVEKNIFEEAILPSETISIKKGNNYIKEIRTKEEIETTTPKSEENTTLYIYIFIGVSVGLFFHLLSSKKPKKDKESKRKTFNIIELANKKDIQNLQVSLIEWAKNKYKTEDIFSLKDISKLANNDAFSKELEEISSQLYSSKETNWDNKNFKKIFKEIEKAKNNTEQKKEILPKLYK